MGDEGSDGVGGRPDKDASGSGTVGRGGLLKRHAGISSCESTLLSTKFCFKRWIKGTADVAAVG